MFCFIISTLKLLPTLCAVIKLIQKSVISNIFFTEFYYKHKN
jgi:hypothetical protein